MLTHIIYTQVLDQVDIAFCARLPRSEVRRQITQMIGEAAHARGMRLPRWEIQVLARQLMHDIPNAERTQQWAQKGPLSRAFA